MTLLTLVALLTLSLTDPSGDAIGDGSLEPPTSPIYANAAQFDLLGVELHSPKLGDADAAAGSRLTITMGSLAARDTTLLSQEQGEERAPTEDDSTADAPELPEDPVDGVGDAQEDTFDLTSLLAVIDVYIGSGDGGLDRTLTGPNMLMPLGHGWRHAVRLSADGAMAVTYLAASELDQEGVPPAPPAGAVQDLPADADYAVEWLSVTRRGNDLVVELPWEFEDNVELYAVSGIHDPFSSSGWRSLSQQPSPWAFSGGSQVSPVIDLVAADAEAQSAALASGVLPLPPRDEPGFTFPRTPWLYLMIGGLLLAAIGLVMRGRVPAAGKVVDSEEEAITPPPAQAEAETPTPTGNEGTNDEMPTPADGVALADEPSVAAETVTSQDDSTATKDGAQDEAILVRDEPKPLDQPSLAKDPTLPEESTFTVEHVARDEPEVLGEPPSTAHPAGVGNRSLVDSGVEGSYLGADSSGFGDDESDEVELDESFWHPSSRKPTLTDVNIGELEAAEVSSGKVGNSKVIVRDDDANPG